MEKRYQVFVSSTYPGPCGRAVRGDASTVGTGLHPIGYGALPRSGRRPVVADQHVIDDCDYYLVIVGGRYGSITADGVSYTEKEYEYAVETGKPILGFIHDDPESLTARDTEKDPEAVQKLVAFREKVRSRPIREYSTPDKLGSVVSRSLIKLMRDQPGEGWVKGRYAMTSEAVAEVSELRAKLAEIELERATTLTTSVMDTTDLAQGEEEITLDFIYESGSATSPQKDIQLINTWDEIFGLVGPALIDEANEEQMRARVESDGLMSLEDSARNRPYSRPRLRLTHASFDQIKLQLRALNLIEKGTKKRGVTDKETYWRLTEFGDRYLVSLTAIRTTKD